MSGWFMLKDGGYLNPDHVPEVGYDREGKYHYAITEPGHERAITDPDTIIRQLLPCSEPCVCVDAYRGDDGQWCFVETPIVGFALSLTGTITPVLISDLDTVAGDNWAIRQKSSRRIWLPYEACYEDIEHWREMLDARDADEAARELEPGDEPAEAPAKEPAA